MVVMMVLVMKMMIGMIVTVMSVMVKLIYPW